MNKDCNLETENEITEQENENKLTIQEGFGELKLLEKRIEKKINHLDAIQVKKKNESTVKGIEVKEYEKNTEESYQSVNDLIDRYNTIKAKINLSNSKTEVIISGIPMKVAEAIAYKNNGILFEKKLLDTLEDELNDAMRSIDQLNEQVSKSADVFAELNKDEKKQSSDITKNREEYYEKNKYHLIDPLHIETKIKELEQKIYNFESTIDSKLSISNATTYIYLD